MDRLIRIEEAAHALGTSYQNVRLMVRRGKLVPVKLGPRMLRLREKDVLALVEQATVGSVR